MNPLSRVIELQELRKSIHVSDSTDHTCSMIVYKKDKKFIDFCCKEAKLRKIRFGSQSSAWLCDECYNRLKISQVEQKLEK